MITCLSCEHPIQTVSLSMFFTRHGVEGVADEEQGLKGPRKAIRRIFRGKSCHPLLAGPCISEGPETARAAVSTR